MSRARFFRAELIRSRVSSAFFVGEANARFFRRVGIAHQNSRQCAPVGNPHPTKWQSHRNCALTGLQTQDFPATILRMLLPRFSLRGMFVLLTICGAFFSVASFAYRGNRWAIAIFIALGSLFIVAALHAMAFLGAWVLSLIVGSRWRAPMPRSPFADSSPSPQVIAPTEPE